jgi:hypothetical protein
MVSRVWTRSQNVGSKDRPFNAVNDRFRRFILADALRKSAMRQALGKAIVFLAVLKR